MKINTVDLIGAPLNYMVAVCQKFKNIHVSPAWKNEHGACGDTQVMVSNKKGLSFDYSPSSNWIQGGGVIEEGIYLHPNNKATEWAAGGLSKNMHDAKPGALFFGPTPLVAAMRYYVASKLGDVVEVPDDLLCDAVPVEL